MTEAARWLEICGTRVANAVTPIVDDPWCRRLLYEAARGSAPCGANGIVWIFADESSLITSRQGVVVR